MAQDELTDDDREDNALLAQVADELNLEPQMMSTKTTPQSLNRTHTTLGKWLRPRLLVQRERAVNADLFNTMTRRDIINLFFTRKMLLFIFIFLLRFFSLILGSHRAKHKFYSFFFSR